MRAAPALQITVSANALWRAAHWLLAGLSVLVMLAWVWGSAPLLGVLWPSAWAVLLCAPALAVARPWRDFPPVQLRWDGAVWHAGPVGPAGSEPWQGEVNVALDVGAWLLLRLAVPPRTAAVPAWLAVSRHSQGAAWHPLRCALYSPRPQRVPDAMEPGPATHERP